MFVLASTSVPCGCRTAVNDSSPPVIVRRSDGSAATTVQPSASCVTRFSSRPYRASDASPATSVNFSFSYTIPPDAGVPEQDNHDDETGGLSYTATLTITVGS